VWIVRRLLLGLGLSLFLSLLLFGLLGAMPGRSEEAVLEAEDPERVDRLRGRDLDPWTRYRCWWLGRQAEGCQPWPGEGLLRGDLGFSWVYRRPLTEILPGRLAASVGLCGPAITVAAGVALLLGAFAARTGRSGTWIAWGLRVGSALPQHWLGLLVLWLGAVKLGAFPVAPGPEDGWLSQVGPPAGVLVVFLASRWARFVRDEAIRVAAEEHVFAARARGVPPARLWLVHILPASAIPLVALVAQSVPTVFSGAVVLETVFSYPGMGRLIYESILSDDALTAVTVFVVYAFTTFAVGALADGLVQWIDPRVRWGQGP
jgi:peptide/nickel transport system permease protein